MDNTHENEYSESEADTLTKSALYELVLHSFMNVVQDVPHYGRMRAIYDLLLQEQYMHAVWFAELSTVETMAELFVDVLAQLGYIKDDQTSAEHVKQRASILQVNGIDMHMDLNESDVALAHARATKRKREITRAINKWHKDKQAAQEAQEAKGISDE